MINLANRIGAFSFAEWGQIVAVRQMNASFLRRFVVWVFACKREFQTDPTQAFIDVHDRELDFFESFLYQDKKDSPRGGERNSERSSNIRCVAIFGIGHAHGGLGATGSELLSNVVFIWLPRFPTIINSIQPNN